MAKKEITAKIVVEELRMCFWGDKEDLDYDLIEKYLTQPYKDFPPRISISVRALELFDEYIYPDREENSELNSINHAFISSIVDAAYFVKGSRKR